MTKKLKGILIDPVAQTVTAVNVPRGYKNIYPFLSDPPNGLSVDRFTVVTLGHNDALYVDDEGLLKDPRYFFLWRGFPQPLAGRGLILGTDSEGESTDAAIDLSTARRSVVFTEMSVKGFHTTEQTSPSGESFCIRTEPVFGPAKNEEPNSDGKGNATED